MSPLIPRLATLIPGNAVGNRSFQPWVILVLPSGGFFTFAAWLLFFNWWKKRRTARAEAGGAR